MATLRDILKPLLSHRRKRSSAQRRQAACPAYMASSRTGKAAATLASELMPFTRMVLPPKTKAIKVQAWTDSSQVALAERTRRQNRREDGGLLLW